MFFGCATVPREAGFGDVASAAAQRTGGMRVHWNQGTEADAAVAAELREMVGGGRELAVDEVVQIALLGNRRLQASYEELMIAQADLVAAGLLSNPVFEAEVSFIEGGGGTGYEFSVVQEFLGIFQIPLRKRIAGARFEAAKLRVAGAVLDLAADTRQAYYNAVAASQMLEMRQTSLAAAEAAYELAQRIHAAGNITDLALDQQRAAFEQAKLDVAAAEYEVLARREVLNVLMGLAGEPAEAWQTPVRLPEPPEEVLAGGAGELDLLIEQALEQSLDLAAIRQDVQQAARQLGLQRTAGLLPHAELGAKGEREPDGEWSAGPVLELPIPLLNQGQPQIAAAAARLRQARADYQATQVELRSAVRAAHALVENAAARVLHYRETVLPLRARIVEQTQLEYNAMITGAFELLSARRQQVEAGGQYIQALREYWIAQSALESLRSGRLRSAPAPAPGGGPDPGAEAPAGEDH